MMSLKCWLLVLMMALAGAITSGRQWEPGPPPPVAPYGQGSLPDEIVVEPMIFPILAKTRWTNDYGTQRSGFLHTAIDIRAAKMSPIVAPIDGIIGFKEMTFWIYGDDGWAVLGTHLNNDNIGTHDASGPPDVMFAPNLVSGQHVYAGQFIGYVGMSGDATGPHLHFELFKPGDGPAAPRIRNPYPSLKAAQILSAPRYRITGPKPRTGEMRFDGCIRRIDSVHGFISLNLVAKQLENGKATAIFGPRYLRLKLPDAVTSKSGGWSALQRLGTADVVSCYLQATLKPDDASVIRLILPPAPLVVPNTPAPKVPSPLIAAKTKESTRVPSVLITQAHDYGVVEQMTLPASLRALGLASTVSLETVSKIDLAPYDVILACHPAYGNFPYDADETGRIKESVEKKGGGLLLMGSSSEHQARLSNVGSFALNKLASEFGFTFTHSRVGDVGEPPRQNPATAVPPRWAIDLTNSYPPTSDFLSFGSGVPLFSISRPTGPLLAGFEVGSGRVLACALSPDRMTRLLDSQLDFRRLFVDALKWLGDKRPEHPKEGVVARILPQIAISRGRFDFHCSNLFSEQEARGYVDAFEKIFLAERAELGIDLPDSLPRIDVMLVQTTGAHMEGTEFVKGTSEDLDRFMLGSAKELANQWQEPGKMPGGFRDAWPNFCSLIAGLRFAKENGNKRLETMLQDERGLDWLAKTDPDLTRIDSLRTDHDGVMKAFHMLTTLQKRLGQGLWERFFAAYRPWVTAHPGPLSMPKFVELLSQAANKDLRPWFLHCGTTL